MRVLINYAEYADRVTIHCLADDARTVISPFKRVSSLETLYRLIKYVGGDPDQCFAEIRKWDTAGVGRCEARSLRAARD
jgi:hypothetical protein